MGGKSGTNTVTTNSGPPAVYQQAFQQVMNQATGVAGTPLTQYPGAIVAPLSPDQQGGIAGVENAQGIANPYINAAAQEINNSTTPVWGSVQQFSPSAVQQYESPYTQQVVNATEQQFNNQNAQQLNQVRGNAASQGAFGGDREAVAEAITAGQQQAAQAPVLAGLMNTGYQQALGEFNTQQAAQIGANEANNWLSSQAGYGLSNLGNMAQNTVLSGANALLGTGGLEQQQAQANLNVPYQQFLQRQAYPFQTTGWLANIAENLGASSGGSSSTTSPGPSGLSQLVGAGATGLGLYNAIGGSSGLGSLFGGGAEAGSAIAGIDALGSAAAAATPIEALSSALLLSHGGGIDAPHREHGGIVPFPTHRARQGGIVANDNHWPIQHRASGGITMPMLPTDNPNVSVFQGNGGVMIPQLTGGTTAFHPGSSSSLADYLSAVQGMTQGTPAVAPPPAPAPPPSPPTPPPADPFNLAANPVSGSNGNMARGGIIPFRARRDDGGGLNVQIPPSDTPPTAEESGPGDLFPASQFALPPQPRHLGIVTPHHPNSGPPPPPPPAANAGPPGDVHNSATPAPPMSPSHGGITDSGGFKLNPLLAIGLGIMSGTSPHAGVNIGKGGLEGLNLLENQKLREQQQQQQADYRRGLLDVQNRRADNQSDLINARTGLMQAQATAALARATAHAGSHATEGDILSSAIADLMKTVNPATGQPFTRAEAYQSAKGITVRQEQTDRRLDQADLRIGQGDTRLTNQQNNQAAVLQLRRDALAQARDEGERNRIARMTDSEIGAASRISLSANDYKGALNAVRSAAGNVPAPTTPNPAVTPSLPSAAGQHPAGLAPNARQAPDGQWYVPNPQGGWLRAIPGGP